MRLRILAPDGSSSEKLLAVNLVRLGRDPACEVAFDAAAYPKVSGEHARIERTASGLILTPRSQSNKTLLNDEFLERPANLKVGDRIRLGYSGPTVEVLAIEVPRPKSVAADKQTPRPRQGPSAQPPTDFGATVQAD